MNSGGDSLAKGAVRFTFPPAGGNVSKEAWDRIWQDEPEVEKKDESKKQD